MALPSHCNRLFVGILMILFTFFSAQATHDLVDVTAIIPTIVTDIRYATTDNFTKQKLYPSAKCYLRRDVAVALKKVQDELAKRGLGLKVWDAYRPHRVQFKLWELVPDERYVLDPKKGSRHNRGAAVDVTLIRLDTKKELAMPTGFDDFTERAWRSYDNLSEEVKKNRQLLEDVMKQCGFIGLKTEWWHFDYQGWEQYALLDVPFEELA